MEVDLKSLQSKILDLESKLQFTHSVLEEDEIVNIQQKNVKFTPSVFNSLQTETKIAKKVKDNLTSKTNSDITEEVKQSGASSGSRPGSQNKKIKFEVNLSQLTKVPKLTDIDAFNIRRPQTIVRNGSQQKIMTPK